MTELLTVLQAAPPPHNRIETGKPEPAGSPSAQRDTRYPKGKTESKKQRAPHMMVSPQTFPHNKKRKVRAKC